MSDKNHAEKRDMQERKQTGGVLDEAVQPSAVPHETFKDTIKQVLKTLTYRECEIIKLRYGLDNDFTYTRASVGRIFKIPTYRVQLIEAKAIRKLKHPVRSRKLEEYLNTLADENYAMPEGRLLRKVFCRSSHRRTPNLFEFATSERCQDAFISWLINWAYDEYDEANAPLHRTGVFFLNRLLGLHGIAPPDGYRELRIHKYKAIDILVEVNSDIVVLIEDKVDFIEHSGQLARYLDTVRNDFKNRTPIPVYLKTGDQLEDYEAIENAGWKCFLRRDMLEVLDYGKQQDVENDIFRDFHSRLRQIEAAAWRKQSRRI